MTPEIFFLVNLIKSKFKIFCSLFEQNYLELKTKFMSKFICILFLFFCSLFSYGQNGLSNTTADKSVFSVKSEQVKKEKKEAEVFRNINGSEIELLFKDNLCEILSIKASDLLNESLLKKFKANV